MKTFAADCYYEYLTQNCPHLDSDQLSAITTRLESTIWDEPTSAIDLNNFAVIALIEAEQASDLYERQIYVDMAIQALNKGVELHSHPLCAAHLALVWGMIGEVWQAQYTAWSSLLDTFQSTYAARERISSGIVYLPPPHKNLNTCQRQELGQLIQTEDGYTQSLFLLSESLFRSRRALYSGIGIEILHLAAHLFPNSGSIHLKLGIYNIVNSQWTGLINLHKANQIMSNEASTLQALYLAYRDLKKTEIASYWLHVARELQQQHPACRNWNWTRLELDSNFTYVPFESELILVVEASFHSYVTSVLIAEGDWFEKEMEFWRNWIKPGMIVMDVGANVGVYTFSAARHVGAKGRVLAIEPFSDCVCCLQETCIINELGWVKIIAGAASDYNGKVHLSNLTASAANFIIRDSKVEEMEPGSYHEVSCFTLDSLIERENLNQVDFIKIDTEGHELLVLMGAERVLSEFNPIILYENMDRDSGGNVLVATYLEERGYQLFRYQSYIQQLIPIKSIDDLHSVLNIIALPKNYSHT